MRYGKSWGVINWDDSQKIAIKLIDSKKKVTPSKKSSEQKKREFFVEINCAEEAKNGEKVFADAFSKTTRCLEGTECKFNLLTYDKEDGSMENKFVHVQCPNRKYRFEVTKDPESLKTTLFPKKRVCNIQYGITNF